MKKLSILVFVLALMVAAFPATAQEPAVTVSDQVVNGDTVVVDSVTSDGPGWIVIHAEADGTFGPVIGQAAVNGTMTNVEVDIDTTNATPVLYAMLHVDTGEEGVYEFGEVEGADGPVIVDEAPLSPPFNVQLLNALPQFVDGAFTAQTVVTDADGWLVIHAEQDGSFGPVIGTAPVTAGNNASVTVELTDAATGNLWPMLHVDTGEAGVYEFGEVEGADGPIAIDGVVATYPVPAQADLVVADQIVIPGDGMGMAADTPSSIMIDFALSDGPGWIAVHQNVDGAPGPVIGTAALEDGLNVDVLVELDGEMLTSAVWPMLHVDTGEVGVYEFGEVDGADGPVIRNEAPVMYPVQIAPSFEASAQPVAEGTLTIDSVLTDAPGWIVIHASVDGAPGPVLGQAPVEIGLNENVVVSIADLSTVEGAATDQVFPMLHYDTGEAGVYEFDGENGLDLPVIVDGNVVVGPLAIEG